MEIEFNQEELAFRDEVREFLKNDYPSHVKEKQDLGVPLSKQDMIDCLLYTSPSPRDQRGSRMPSSA